MKYFGTDGFRGRINKDLSVEHALKIGQYIGWYFSQDGTPASIVIGKDTRRSSYMLEYGLCAGITSSGADVYIMHVTTTPSVSYITKREKFNCGIMITASHNPYYDNGIKIIDSEGNKMNEEFLQEIEDYIDGIRTIPVSEETGRCIDYLAGRNSYIGHLASIPEGSFRGYKIGLDCANGASSTIAKNVFAMLGADTYVISDQPDGKNINRGCGSTHIEALQNFVVEKGLDIGFAFDGDADRCIAVNEKGEVMDGDYIIYMIACMLKEQGKLTGNKAVITVMSNLGLINALKANDIDVVITDVGDKYVAAEIAEHGYKIGGEQSGHIIISKYANTGDGILTAIIVTEILVNKKTFASALPLGLKILPQKLVNVAVTDKDRIMNDPKIIEYIEETNKKLDGSGRLLLRKSGTEPLIRIMAEAATEADCDRIIEDAKAVVDSI
ncbi:MAG: phosphoglucosamine mutase [Lachnospiraceae bacterium]|nr:phosphoglucosamine mutase [Lachnospiraceae bacterium]